MCQQDRKHGMGTQRGGQGGASELGWRGRAGGEGTAGVPSSLTPAPDLGRSQGGPLTIPHSHPQFPLWKDEAGRFHSFREGSEG